MAKPASAVAAPVNADLSYTSLEDAATHLPPAKRYRLVVSPDAARDAAKLLGVHAKTVEEHPLAPPVGLEFDPSFDLYEWCLYSGDACFWSPGA